MYFPRSSFRLPQKPDGWKLGLPFCAQHSWYYPLDSPAMGFMQCFRGNRFRQLIKTDIKKQCFYPIINFLLILRLYLLPCFLIG